MTTRAPLSFGRSIVVGTALFTLALTTGCPTGGPGGPSIGVSPTSLTFTAMEGGANPQSQTIELNNIGIDTLDWSVSVNQTWLTVTPMIGNITTEKADLTVSVDITALIAAGSPYTGQISVSAPGASNTPRAVGVTLIISEPGVDCDVLPSTVDTDMTLAAGCYVAESDVSVTGGATLTIQPGVTVFFQTGNEMTVGSDGQLSAVGTAAQPIIFTGEQAIRGYWGGLRFYQSNSLQNRLDNVTIQYGGGWWDANLYLDGTSSAPSRIDITNCTLRGSEKYGIYIDGDVIVGAFSGNRITENTVGAGNVSANVAGYLDDTSTYAGNDADVVRVWGSTVSDNQAWAGIDADYLIAGDIGVSAELTIAPGARLVFQASNEMTVNGSGRLWAVGTPDQRVVFTGEEEIRGYWGGLRFYQSNSTSNRLDFVTIEYGGGWWDANLYLDGTSSTPTRLNVTNCTMRHSGSYGFYFDGDVVIGEFNGNTVTANTLGAGNLSANVAGFLDDTSTYVGNDANVVRLWGSTVSDNQVWAGIDADYLVAGDIGVSAELTIAPGARVVFQSGNEMTVRSNGQLSAVGNALERIVFTGEEPTPGFWGGLRFYQSNAAENRLDFVTIEYGGGWWDANLYVDGTSSSPTQLRVTNCSITDSTTWGIYLDEYADVNADIDTANTFANNASGDIRWP